MGRRHENKMIHKSCCCAPCLWPDPHVGRCSLTDIGFLGKVPIKKHLYISRYYYYIHSHTEMKKPLGWEVKHLKETETSLVAYDTAPWPGWLRTSTHCFCNDPSTFLFRYLCHINAHDDDRIFLQLNEKLYFKWQQHTENENFTRNLTINISVISAINHSSSYFQLCL